jgi:hypothetical protein
MCGAPGFLQEINPIADDFLPRQIAYPAVVNQFPQAASEELAPKPPTGANRIFANCQRSSFQRRRIG